MSTTQILVVEDERLVATAIQNELQQFGYHVSAIASSAAEAVEKAFETKPDLVLMDIQLKGGPDGIDAASRIQQQAGIPVVYLSAFSDAATISRASETGAFGYLLKPYEERELHTTIETALAKHRAVRQLDETRRWLTAVLHGITDAVIAADPDNRVHFLNLAAEALTNWREYEAIGAPLAAVCSLVDNDGRVILEDFADRAVCESRAIDLPPSAHLVCHDGRETPVTGKLAAIYDARDDFLGIVLTLRDSSSNGAPQRGGANM